MDVNNNISETAQSKQPSKPQTPHETAKKEARNSIFDYDKDGVVSQEEQYKYLEKNINCKDYKYLTKEDYNEILRSFTSFGEMKVNEYIERKMESLKVRIEKKLADENEKKQFFGLAETVDKNSDGTTHKEEIIDKIHELIDTKEYKNLDEGEIKTIISGVVYRSFPTEEFSDGLLQIFVKHTLEDLKRANEDQSKKKTTINNAGKTIEEMMADLENQKQKVKESTSELLRNYEHMVMLLLLKNDPEMKETAKATRELLEEADLDKEQLEKFNRLSKDLDELKPSVQ